MAVTDTDVVVVGAGVGGLALGVALAQAGLPSLLLEAGDGVKPQPRGELLQPNGLRVLADLGLLERLLALDVQVIHTIRVHRRGGELLAALDYRVLDPPCNEAVACRPHRLRRLLLEHLDGAQVWWQARVAGLERTPSGWAVQVQTPGGVRRLRARMVVAADGARSHVRRLLGIRARVRAYRDAYALTVLPRPSGFPGELWQYQGGGALLGLVPVARDELYLYWHVPAQRLEAFWRHDFARLSAALRRVAPDWGEALVLPPAGEWTAAVPVRVVPETWVVDGGALLGDAAHALNPNAAQGTNQALEDARALAEVLAGALRRGRVDAASLAAYERARRPAAASVQRLGEASARLWTSGNPLVDWLQARATRNLGRHVDLLRKAVAQAAGLRAQPLSAVERLRLLT